MIKLGILGSTKGSDVPPIADAIIAGELDASIEIIITNNKDALIADKALKYGVDFAFIDHKNKSREEFDKQISKKLLEKEVDLVLLIGFMRILSAPFIKMWDKKILNVHPSLLPKYAGGMNNNVHESVLKNEDKETGCTIHLVTTQVDQGPIVVQKKCGVFKNDTVESLKNRVQRLEGEAFIESIKSWGKK
ncbi:MAG: phosphoribosylglycinamide formyltransferase [Candidatus Neomarinimicrobiota bacterium]|nr:MAG: phosphoribosylglycinamide formyltransferase [Euryarchaeota archaeon TMED164]